VLTPRRTVSEKAREDATLQPFDRRDVKVAWLLGISRPASNAELS